MKKILTLVLMLVLVIGLVGCGERFGDTVLKEPPALTVICGESSVEALKGTYSWNYSNGDGTATAVSADSMHPLDSKDYMPVLSMNPEMVSESDGFVAYLQFEVSPDELMVNCWSEDAWGNLDATSEAVVVSKYEIGTEEPMFKVSLKDGSYIYEVIAKWNSSELYGGTAYYSFYTMR